MESRSELALQVLPLALLQQETKERRPPLALYTPRPAPPLARRSGGVVSPRGAWPARASGGGARHLRAAGAPPFSARALSPLPSRVGWHTPAPRGLFPCCVFLLPGPRRLLLTPRGRREGQRGRTWGFVACILWCGVVGVRASTRALLQPCSWETPHPRRPESLAFAFLEPRSLFLWLVLLKTRCFGHCLRGEVGVPGGLHCSSLSGLLGTLYQRVWFSSFS